ncbi:hypothetical protein [Streptomyces sp. NPDC003857]
MQHHFRHALATHGASTILGFRTDGRPIYAVAGGNGEGEDGWTTGTPPTANIEGTPPARRPSAPPAEFAPGGDSAERQAESRKWERHDMDYKGAADELAARKASQRSEQEKVAAAAETRDRKAAALKHGWDLAATRFETAAVRASIDLSEAAELIDTARFVDQQGNVDMDGIAAAVKMLAKIAPKSSGRSGGDLRDEDSAGQHESLT